MPLDSPWDGAQAPVRALAYGNHERESKLFHSWRLLQEICGVYDASDEGEARERIESFVHHWHETAIPEFRSVLKALAQWMPEILAFHRTGRISNGRPEGTIICTGQRAVIHVTDQGHLLVSDSLSRPMSPR